MITTQISGLDELINRRLPEMVNKCVRHVLSTVFRLVTPDSRDTGFAFGSPVLTGQFYTNHMLSVGVPSYSVKYHMGAGVLPPLNPDSYVILKTFRIGQVAFITNNLNYAQQLEDGKSKKAPQGIYRKSAELTAVGLRYENWDLIARM